MISPSLVSQCIMLCALISDCGETASMTSPPKKPIDQISGNAALDGVPFKIYGVQ